MADASSAFSTGVFVERFQTGKLFKQALQDRTLSETKLYVIDYSALRSPGSCSVSLVDDRIYRPG